MQTLIIINKKKKIELLLPTPFPFFIKKKKKIIKNQTLVFVRQTIVSMGNFYENNLKKKFESICLTKTG